MLRIAACVLPSLHFEFISINRTILTGIEPTGLFSKPGRIPRPGGWLQCHTMPCSLHTPSVGPAPIRTPRVFASCDNPSRDVRNGIHHKLRRHSVQKIQLSFVDLLEDRWVTVPRLVHQASIYVVLGLRDLRMKYGKSFRVLELRSIAQNFHLEQDTRVSKSCLQRLKTKISNEQYLQRWLALRCTQHDSVAPWTTLYMPGIEFSPMSMSEETSLRVMGEDTTHIHQHSRPRSVLPCTS